MASSTFQETDSAYLAQSRPGLFLWIPTTSKQQAGHISVLEIGLISAIPFLVAVVCQYLNARRSIKVMERRRHVSIAAVIGAAGLLVLPLVSGVPWVASLVLTVIATGISTITAFFAGVGSLITPVVSGWMSATTGSLSNIQLMSGALLGAGVLVILKPIKHDIIVMV